MAGNRPQSTNGNDADCDVANRVAADEPLAAASERKFPRWVRLVIMIAVPGIIWAAIYIAASALF